MRISKHIDSSEITCKCGCGFDNLDVKAIVLFERLRAAASKFNGFDTPIIINCACRCGKPTEKHPEYTDHNKAVGGVENSRHKVCDAFDLKTPKGLTNDEFHNLCDNVVNKFGGVGYYSWGCHVDTRGYHSRWGK